MKQKTRRRVLLIVVLTLLFGGLCALSILRVRYGVGDSTKTEAAITRLSLTHSVVRDERGRLEMAAGKAEGEPGTGTGKEEPCPT